MVKAVSVQLGNTAAVCRKYYIHPAVIDCYLRGDLSQYLLRSNVEGELHPEEVAVLKLIKAQS
ncbi:MAG: hypothetical protein QM755_12155 [Luteolibacter sp.]